MDLYVVRHAIAVERSATRPDAERALTAKGRRRFEQGVLGLGRLGARFERVLHSPWLRAAQTAELLAPLSETAPEETTRLAAAPSGALLGELGTGCVAVVGHEPWLSELVAWLTVGDPGGGHAFALKKGGVAWLEGEPHPGAMGLAGFWRPRQLRAIAAQTVSPASER